MMKTIGNDMTQMSQQMKSMMGDKQMIDDPAMKEIMDGMKTKMKGMRTEMNTMKGDMKQLQNAKK